MHPALTRVDHRPWPLPAGRWVWRQCWHDLLFAHWRLDADAVRPLVPPPLAVQERDGSSWIGVVPFHMTGVMRRPLPDLPGLSAFAELNLRLYVEHEGKPGVWFLSLDAANALAVRVARRFFHLPYHHAEMRVRIEVDRIAYASRRSQAPDAAFEADYGPLSAPFEADAGSLDHWLTERYCLYAMSPAGRLFRTDIHHHPWPLQRAWAEIRRNSIGAPLGLSLNRAPDLLHFSRRIDVVVWAPVEV